MSTHILDKGDLRVRGFLSVTEQEIKLEVTLSRPIKAEDIELIRDWACFIFKPYRNDPRPVHMVYPQLGGQCVVYANGSVTFNHKKPE